MRIWWRCWFAMLSGCGFPVWDTEDSKWKRYPLGTSFSLICPPLADPCDTYLELFPLDRTDPFLGLAIIQGSTLPLFVIRSWPSMVQCIYRCKWWMFSRGVNSAPWRRCLLHGDVISDLSYGWLYGRTLKAQDHFYIQLHKLSGLLTMRSRQAHLTFQFVVGGLSIYLEFFFFFWSLSRKPLRWLSSMVFRGGLAILELARLPLDVYFFGSKIRAKPIKRRTKIVTEKMFSVVSGVIVWFCKSGKTAAMCLRELRGISWLLV